MAVDSRGMPVRFIVTKGTTADCTQADELTSGIVAQYLLADKGYDSNKIIAQAKNQGMEPVIPPKRKRKIQRPYDKDLYKLRHIIENTFLRLKDWRGIATRYAKNVKSFIAAVQIRCIVLWLKIS
jgi:transposase